MKPDKKTIDSLIAGITQYNNAKTAKEGFGALNNLINIGEKQLLNKQKEVDKQIIEELRRSL